MSDALRPRKRIGLAAHDHKKDDLVEWGVYNRRILVRHELIATGTTGTLLEDRLGWAWSSCKAGPWEATSRSVGSSRTAPSTCSSSSGTCSTPNRTTLT